MAKEQYCPKCGTKLIHLAECTFFTSSEDDRLIREQLEKSERWKRAWGEALKTTRMMDVDFLVCGNCKLLFLGYGYRGYYFDTLGNLTDEAVALLIAGKLKEGKE